MFFESAAAARNHIRFSKLMVLRSLPEAFHRRGSPHHTAVMKGRRKPDLCEILSSSLASTLPFAFGGADSEGFWAFDCSQELNAASDWDVMRCTICGPSATLVVDLRRCDVTVAK